MLHLGLESVPGYSILHCPINIFLLLKFFFIYIVKQKPIIGLCLLNFRVLHFCKFFLQIIEQSFSYLKVRFVMTRLACFVDFYEKVPGKLFRDGVGKGYDCLYNLLLDFEAVLLSSKSS